MNFGLEHWMVGGVFAAVSGGMVWGVMSARAKATIARVSAELEVAKAELIRKQTEISAMVDRSKEGQRELMDVQAEMQLESAEAQASVARLGAELAAEQRRGKENVLLLEKAEEKLTQTFRALSSEALKHSQEQFLVMAQSTLKGQQDVATGELEKQQQAVAQLVKPLGDSLVKMEGKMGEMEKEREGAYAGLSQQVKQMGRVNDGLQRETAQLVKALRQPAGRGQWGELQLRRVVEMAGMLEYCDFQTQVSVKGDNGLLRPDLLVQLPGGQQIVVDAKATMDAYLDATEAVSEDIRKVALLRHVEQVRTQMKRLSQKRYHEQFAESPEFVVLFLPSEAFFSAALEQDATLIEKSTKMGVILATPTTLIALLRAVAHGWKQESLAQNAREISEVGGEFYRRILTFVGHLDKLGRSLDGSVKSYNQAIGSLESRLIGGARKLEELGVAAELADIQSPEQVETQVRELKVEGAGGAHVDEPLADFAHPHIRAGEATDLWAEFEGFETGGQGEGI